MKEETQKTYRERILRTLVHIQDHLDEELVLKDLSMLSAFSPYHFHRIFHGLVGESVYQYVRRLRLERAALKLRTTELPVIELAFEASYDTHEAFSRAFKEMFGFSPSGFRDRVDGEILRPTGLFSSQHSEPAELASKVEVKHLPDRKIAFARHVGLYAEVGEAFDRLLLWAAPQGLLGAGVEYLGICYDHPEITPADKIRYDAAMTVDDDIQADGDIGVRLLPGGDHAVVCHEGPYDAVGDTYDFIYGAWLPNQSRLPSDSPAFEVYLNDPHGTEPEDLLTDIHVPLEPIGGYA